uniref:Protein kinase domain-containing protein n=1 Tax=Brassica oleracea TaxID=3712 RepID=A0A3P6CYJ4_BRAOL|nr:unnamed protein product [Brassica oleracea]
MVRSLGILLLIIRTLAIIHIVQAQSQQGFISLDCGLPANEPSPYKEEATGLQLSSDATFIQSGKTGRIHPTVASRFLKPYTTLRYFPDGTRNCYNLRVEKGRNHLIRASFLYGNYDGLDNNPTFDLYLGPNPWATIDLHKLVNGTREEIIHIPTSNKLQVCLVKTGPTTPLISTLEVRPMGNDSYSTQSGSLNLFFRFYFSESKTTLRYPDDVYDRQWTAYFWKEWTQITTTSNVGNTNDYEPPKAALATAAIPTNGSEPLTLEWSNTDKPDDQYYLYRHFAEIQDLRSNETREFNMVWNGELMSSDPLVPDEFKITTILSLTPRTCAEGECSFQLKRTNRSTLPPLLNAFEVYTVIQFPQSETNENEVAAIRNIEATYGLSRINWQGDPCVPSQLMWDALSCSHVDISTPPRITSLNLSSSGLTGNIAAAIQNLTLLEKLDLSNNNLTGEVPEFLGNMKLLLVINLSGNDLNGSIPQSLQRKGLVLSLEGNSRLFPSGSPEKTHKKTLLVPIVASVGSVAILIAALVLYLVLRKKKQPTVEAVVRPPPSRPTVNVTNANSPEPSIETKKRRFTYSEVIKMTNNFERVVGEGGFGVVCHGTVNGGQVAVKLLSQSSTQGYKEFKAEVDLLLRVHHTNLVSLVGYCDEGDHLALIYEFVPNGDLRQHLTGKGGRSVVNWGIRLRIAVEAALGLEYLHIGCTPPMVHRDVKTTNILLDEHYKAKLADFGLSRSFPVGGESHVSTVVAGTPGYLDPEYYHTGRLGEKSDVYSFGIVLLEMITNQSVIDRNRRNSHITKWVGSELKGGNIANIMDPNLHGDYDSRSAWRALELAMSCADPTSAKRPTMSHVVIELKECLVSENSRRNMSRRMDSLSSPEVSMTFDSDASWKKETNTAAFGCIFKSREGQIIHTTSRVERYVASPLIAEAPALRWTLTTALSQGFHSICFHTYYKSLLAAISSKLPPADLSESSRISNIYLFNFYLFLLSLLLRRMDIPTTGSPPRLKRNSNDVGWDYGVLCDARFPDKVKCILCGKEFSGGIYRMKEHIGHCETRSYKHSKSAKGKLASDTVMSCSFWNNVMAVLKVFSPMVKVLRLADGEKIPSLGFIYGELLVAKNSIKEATDHLEKNYQPIFRIIDEKMKGRIDSPLHMAAYFLNPFYFYKDPNIQCDLEVMDRFI